VTDVVELAGTLEALRVAEEELRAQNEELAAARLTAERDRRRYEELFDLAPVAYVLTDGYGKILEANEAASHLLGVGPRLLPGKVLASFVPHRERRAFRRLLLSLVGTTSIVESELRLLPPRRDELVVAAHVLVVTFPDDEDELRWSLRDVTAQRQAEVELRLLTEELEARVAERAAAVERERTLLRAVVEQVPAGLVVVDAATEQMSLANAKAVEMFGEWTAAAVETSPLRRSLREGVVVSGERVEVVGDDGRPLVFEVDSGPVRGVGDGLVGAVGVFIDVTERERLHRAEREFVTNAAHELRTPLAAISSAVEVLQAGAKDVPRERDHFLDHIDRECRRLARLTTALLSLARAQGGVETPRVDLVQLCPLLEQLAGGARAADGVAVEADCPTDLVALANPDLLEQALANLVSNAARHTRAGSIVLAARPDGEQAVAVEIRDTGSGMTNEERARVTERFYRGSDGDGFGLGLAIAADAVRAVGGELDLESEVGRGTIARVTLPAARLVSA
jgi:PAS domain S-box-containing protein